MRLLPTLLALFTLSTFAACTPTPAGPENEASCTDGLDEDHDGTTDCADDDCSARPFVCKTHRSTADAPAACVPPTGSTPESCDNLLDDDQDGLPDCNDCDCCGNAACASATCGCDDLAGTWFVGTLAAVSLAAPTGECPAFTFDFQLQQSGCAARVRAIGGDYGAFIPLTKPGAHQFHLQGSLDQSTTVTNVWDFDFTFDSAKGTFTGTSKRTQGNLCEVVGWR